MWQQLPSAGFLNGITDLFPRFLASVLGELGSNSVDAKQSIVTTNTEFPEMSEFVSIAKKGDIPAGEGRTYPVNGLMIGLFFVDGEYFAINDFCPHMGASLASGYVEEGAVSCPWHAWRFCVKDGTWLDNPKSNLKTDCYEVRLDGDDILVNVPTVDEPTSSE